MQYSSHPVKRAGDVSGIIGGKVDIDECRICLLYTSPCLYSRVVGFLLLADYNNILITIVFINQMVYNILSVNLEVLYDYGRND